MTPVPSMTPTGVPFRWGLPVIRPTKKAPVFVQSANEVGTGTTLTFGASTTAGNFLVLVAGGGQSATPTSALSSVSGAGVGTWHQITQTDGSFNGCGADVWYGSVTGTPGTTVTIAWALDPFGTQQATVIEVANVTALDVSGGSTSGGQSSAVAPPFETPAGANELFVCSASCGVPSSGTPNATFTSALTSGWTALGSTGHVGYGAYLIASDSAPHRTTFTLSTALENWSAVTAVFR